MGRSDRIRAWPTRRLLQERATANLTAAERRHLESALTKIIHNLEGIAPAAEEADDEIP